MPKSHLHETLNYMPAVVKQTAAWGLHIEYYIMNPTTDAMERRRVRLARLVKRYTTKRDRLLAAQKVADNLNAKLRGGWSPLHETDDARLYTRLADLQTKFLAAKMSEGCRPTTLTQYKSVTDLWLRWCEDNGLADRYSGTYLRAHAVRYMDDVLELGHRHRSYNNTLKVMKAFFQWSLEHLYAKENPFIGMKTLKKEPKIRILIPPEARQKIAAHYGQVRPAMIIVCQLVYSSAIRPAEIMKIQLKHIHLDRHYIVIPSENAKNHKERYASITPSLDGLLTPVMAKYKNLDLYLFGKNENLDPDVSPVAKQYFQKSWERMRKATGLPKEMQLYSLRDTGLTDLIHAGVDQLTVQHHADHSSLAIQNIYTDHFDPGLTDKIFNNAPAF
jgi:site-specific recombinase XerD